MTKRRFWACIFISVLTSSVLVSASASEPVLPNSSQTPGAIDANVTQENIHSTICVSGYTTKVRPSSSYTTNLKEMQLSGSYSFYGHINPGDFEEDHLIPLEIGGSPTSVLNLWPEPYSSVSGARIKDVLENKLHELVCNGTVTLSLAQESISSNWYVAYEKYILNMNVDISSNSGTAIALSTGDSVKGSKVPFSASAKCRDGTLSYSKSRSGTCNKHGGVATWSTNPGTSSSPTLPTPVLSLYPAPTPSPIDALDSRPSSTPSAPSAQNFSMPLVIASNINQLVSKWSSYGFVNPPVIAVENPVLVSDSCAPWQGSSGLASFVYSTDPKYLSQVTPQTQVTITLFCQEIFNASNLNPTGAPTESPTPSQNPTESPTPSPIPTSIPTETPTPSPSTDTGSSTSLGSKTCYVHGYVTKKGTVVSGYFRSC